MSMSRIAVRAGVVLLACVAFLGTSVSRAEAAPLRAWLCTTVDCSAAGDIYIVDNAPGDFSVETGLITIMDGIRLEISTSYPVTGSQSNPYLNLTYILNGLGVGGERYLYVTQDEFTYVGPLNFLANSSTGSGTATVYGGTGVWAGPAAPGSVLCGPDGFTPTPSGSAACTFDAPAAPFYMAIGLHIVANGTGNATGDATIQVPEPASMALFGLGLFGLAAASRRRKP
jgi:hypothetical protein